MQICISKNLSLQQILQRKFALLHLKIVNFGSSIGKLNILNMVVLEILWQDFYLALKYV